MKQNAIFGIFKLEREVSLINQISRFTKEISHSLCKTRDLLKKSHVWSI